MSLIYVRWPAHAFSVANVWRVLDFSGLTRNPRESERCVRSGIVFLNGNMVTMKDTVEVGCPFTLEVRYPGGKIKSKDISLTKYYYPEFVKPRNNTALTVYKT